jgi:hypothetical protein
VVAGCHLRSPTERSYTENPGIVSFVKPVLRMFFCRSHFQSPIPGKWLAGRILKMARRRVETKVWLAVSAVKVKLVLFGLAHLTISWFSFAVSGMFVPVPADLSFLQKRPAGLEG